MRFTYNDMGAHISYGLMDNTRAGDDFIVNQYDEFWLIIYY